MESKVSFSEIDCGSSTIVLSKGISAFQTVIDDFPNAERVTVVTYSISTTDRKLLDALSEAGAKACIICNIPKRFERYFGNTVRASAKSQIKNYLELLDPTRFQTVFETFFSFRNHAKIVMTENVAYIGSANFSSESQHNWECGIITVDANAIAQLEMAVEQIKADSIRYIGGSTNLLFSTFTTIYSLLDSIWGKFNKDCLDELASSLDDVERAIAEIDMPWAFAFESGGPLTSKIDMNLLKQLQHLACDADTLRNFASFDPESVVVDDFPRDAYEERLDSYIESAMADNTFRMEEFELIAKNDLEALRTGLETLYGQLKSVINEISVAQSKIDNT
jgi:phosphatidylserine/phosphatidylglycerophosphate/cardiolipin synthase-like enzyme